MPDIALFLLDGITYAGCTSVSTWEFVVSTAGMTYAQPSRPALLSQGVSSILFVHWRHRGYITILTRHID